MAKNSYKILLGLVILMVNVNALRENEFSTISYFLMSWIFIGGVLLLIQQFYVMKNKKG
jgi:hypothetical protein